MTLNTWINFNGNAEEAFGFYKSVFGGEFSKVVRFKDLTNPENESAMDEQEGNRIMLITLPIGSGTLMANDVPEAMGPVNENENRSKITINADTKEEADTLFGALSAGGDVEVPMCDGPWGSYFGMFRDKYGIEWVIEFYSK